MAFRTYAIELNNLLNSATHGYVARALAMLVLSLFSLASYADALGKYDDERTNVVKRSSVSVQIDQLYKPSHRVFYKASAYETYGENRNFLVPWYSFAPWSVPLEPTWSESPYGDRSWELYYQSLVWLYSLAYGHDQDNSLGLLEEAANYIQHYHNNNPPENSPSSEAWGDGSTAYRASVIAYFYSQYFNELSLEHISSFEAAARVHAQLLVELTQNPNFELSNHGIFHALALYTLGKVFSDEPDSAEWTDRGKARFIQVFSNMVDLNEGVSTEQASAYQFNVINQIRDGYTIFENNNETDVNWIRPTLVSMVEFAASLMYPDGTVTAIGESYFNKNQAHQIDKFVNVNGLGNDVSRFVHSQGSVGTAPKTLVGHRNQGFYVIRPNFSVGPDWTNDAMMIIDVGPAKFSHGHHDATNFSLYAHGTEFLIDTGGPFRYTGAWRAAFAKASMQNVVVIDDHQTSEQPIEVTQARTEPITSNSGAQLVLYSIATERQVGNVVHERNYSLLSAVGDQSTNEPIVVIVSDQFAPFDRSHPHEYRLYHHVAPTTTVTATETGYLLVAENQATMDINVNTTSSLSSSVITGRGEPDYQGWVVPSHSVMVPAPTIEHVMIGAARQRMLTTFASSAPGKNRHSAQVQVIHKSDDVIELTSPRFGTVQINLRGKQNEIKIIGMRSQHAGQ